LYFCYTYVTYLGDFMGKFVPLNAIPHPLAKVSPPVSDQALKRQGLFEKIEILQKYQVIWVSSPAGSGKTTLISTYLQNRGIPCLWYQVDVGDDDPATFFHYLGRATLTSVPRIRKAFPSLTPEYLLGLPAFTLRFFEDICAHLLTPASRKSGKTKPENKSFAIVFDNCQEVPDNSAFHTVLLTGLTRVPSQITVILISRTPPPPAYAKLQANKQMELLGWEDLRLSREEAVRIINLQAGEAVGDETMESIYSSADNVEVQGRVLYRMGPGF
jgi:ATP/maltotriose-dependent transcriptional regulator MalT